MDGSSMKTKLMNIAERHGLHETLERLASFNPEAWKVTVAVIGPFKSGKSTLVNALLGQPLMPVMETPCNANVVEISPSETESFRVRRDSDDGETITEIRRSDLAREVINYEKGKTVLVETKFRDLQLEKCMIVDTPGVHSINDIHDDITFGYLPFIDVALVVFDITKGSPSAEDMAFLSAFSDELLSRIVFVLNKADQQDTDDVKRSACSFESVLKGIIPNPRVITFSASNAIQGIENQDNSILESSGFITLRDTLISSVVKNRREIEAFRFRKRMLAEAKTMISMLREKASSINLSTPELDEKIKRTIDEMNILIREKERLLSLVTENGRKCQGDLNGIVNLHAPAIAKAIAEKENYSDLITEFGEDLVKAIKARLLEIDFSNPIDVKEMNGAIDLASASASAEIASLVVDIGSFLLVAWIVPGKKVGLEVSEALAAGLERVLARSRDDGSDKDESVDEMIRGIGNTLRRINPIEMLKKNVMPKLVLEPQVRSKLLEVGRAKVTAAFAFARQAVDERISRDIQEPISRKKEAIESLRRERDKYSDSQKSQIEVIEADLTEMEKLG
ncbi:MAG: GTPase Era [candidate division Hyd24-12 bacterium ADurb.Bin004]|nr:MAG: GTPase Era [candidate division Hyd24-12 bacterium ADurb.Bin004]